MFDHDTLNQRIEAMNEGERYILLGQPGKDPLGHAFPRPRAFHPGSRRMEVLQGQAGMQAVHKRFQKPESAHKRMAYIHIPFCRTCCLYCVFFNEYIKEERLKRYIDSLIKELRQWSISPYITDRPFCAVYFGGGTPTDLPPDILKRLLCAVHECLPLANDVEITLEGRLAGFDEDRIVAALEGGVNRFSFGVQSFDTKVRRQLGRLLSREEILEHLAAMKMIGHAPVGIDLIYGLPDQTMELWERDLKLLLDSKIDGASIYSLKMRENGPLKQAIDEGRLSSAAKVARQAEMYDLSRDLLTEAGYLHVNMSSHWAGSTRDRSIYNNNSIDISDVIPFGCGAGGHIGRLRWMQLRSIDAYQNAVDAARKPLNYAMKGPEEYRIYGVLGHQLNHGGVNLHQIDQIHGDHIEELLAPVCDRWIEQGLMIKKGNRYVLTAAGEFWNTTITQSFYECLDLATPAFDPKSDMETAMQKMMSLSMEAGSMSME